MTKAKVRRIEKIKAKRNRIIIIEGINIKTLLGMGRDCQMSVICRRLLEISRDMPEKMERNQEYAICH